MPSSSQAATDDHNEELVQSKPASTCWSQACSRHESQSAGCRIAANTCTRTLQCQACRTPKRKLTAMDRQDEAFRGKSAGVCWSLVRAVQILTLRQTACCAG